MQITVNTTKMAAAITVVADETGRDHCLVVIKGSFEADEAGQLSLAPEQPPPAALDEHYGDPERSSIRRACDFVLAKPCAEVLVDGFACVPGGEAGERVRELPVALEVEGQRKQALVTGERVWVANAGSVQPSPPVPFTTLPLRFERAFGGPQERRNPLGCGHPGGDRARQLEGLPVPNIEVPGAQINRPSSRGVPVGFGVVGRGWQPRVALAGSYDARWRSERCPFLPEDFDRRYYLSAPEDQHFPHFVGGELIRCYHMAPRPVVRFVLPTLRVPVRARFAGRAELGPNAAVLDTVILEPHRARAELVWRTSFPLGKKLNALREILIGALDSIPGEDLLGYREGKPHFRSLGAALRWLGRGHGRRRG